jgi:hypothetical protein
VSNLKFAALCVAGFAAVFFTVVLVKHPEAAGIVEHVITGLTGLGTALAYVLGFYFLPLIVALARGHRQKLAIGVLNFLLGWTLIGWVVAMVWACTNDR